MSKNSEISGTATTERAKKLREKLKSFDELSDLIGISKATLFKRFMDNKWEKSQMYFIDNLYSFYFYNKNFDKSAIEYNNEKR